MYDFAAHPEPAPGYRAALARLYALGQGRMLPGRDRLRRVLTAAGDPHLAVPSVLIGGTNGKGKLTAALSAVLSRRYRTFAFIKPHLKSIRERWRIGDAPVEAAQFVAATEQALGLIAAAGEPISFFEANVLLGSLLARDSGCELALWEVGLGGKEDACNLADPLVSVITNVQYDHQAILGDTLAQIALDKAHIAQPGRPLLLGPPRPGWEDGYAEYAPVIARVAGAIGARFSAVEAHDFRPLGGLADDTNALLQATLGELAGAGYPVAPGDVLAGLAHLRYRGRMELTTLEGTRVLLDAAHNPDSMRWLGRELREAGVGGAGGLRVPFIFGMQATKPARDMLGPVADCIGALVPLAIPVLHPCPVADIIQAADELGIPVSLPPAYSALMHAAPSDVPLDHLTELDPPDDSTGWLDAVRHGLSLARGAGQRAVVCGSIYYLGEILRAFEGPDPA